MCRWTTRWVTDMAPQRETSQVKEPPPLPGDSFIPESELFPSGTDSLPSGRRTHRPAIIVLPEVSPDWESLFPSEEPAPGMFRVEPPSPKWSQPAQPAPPPLLTRSELVQVDGVRRLRGRVARLADERVHEAGQIACGGSGSAGRAGGQDRGRGPTVPSTVRRRRRGFADQCSCGDPGHSNEPPASATDCGDQAFAAGNDRGPPGAARGSAPSTGSPGSASSSALVRGCGACVGADIGESQRTTTRTRSCGTRRRRADHADASCRSRHRQRRRRQRFPRPSPTRPPSNRCSPATDRRSGRSTSMPSRTFGPASIQKPWATRSSSCERRKLTSTNVRSTSVAHWRTQCAAEPRDSFRRLAAKTSESSHGAGPFISSARTGSGRWPASNRGKRMRRRPSGSTLSAIAGR